MADVATAPTQSQGADIVSLIMSAAEPIWKRISSALQVKTREEAVQICQSDPAAAQMVMQIIQGQSALTEGAPAPEQTALTAQGGITVPSAAERLYGSAKAKLQY